VVVAIVSGVVDVVPAVDPGADVESGTVDVVVSVPPPHAASTIAAAITEAIRLTISTVYGRSEFPFTCAAYTDESEVCALDFCESVGGCKLTEHCGHLIGRDVDGPPTPLTHEVLMIPLAGKVDNRRPMAEMHMMQHVEAFEHIERPINRRLVDPNSGRRLGPLSQLGGVEVFPDV
jgi:hypothetical protein